MGPNSIGDEEAGAAAAVASELAKLEMPREAEEDDDGEDDAVEGAESSAAAKKKKKKKKKKKGGGGGAGSGAAGQTSPPSIPVSKLFNGVFPEGEIQRYKDDNLWRETSEEKRELERLEKNMYNEVRQCAEVHREVRKYISDWVKPGMKLIDVCETLENSVRQLIEERGLEVSDDARVSREDAMPRPPTRQTRCCLIRRREPSPSSVGRERRVSRSEASAAVSLSTHREA